MTSGTKSSNRDYYVTGLTSNDCFGTRREPPVLITQREEKTWSGTDSARVEPDTTERFWKFNVPNGRGGYRIKRVRLRPPRVKRSNENPYNMALVRSFNVLVSTQECRCGVGTPYACKRGFTSSSAFYGATHDDPWDSNDDLELIGKLREKIQGADFNLAVFLGEGRDSLATVADAATRIAKSFKLLRKGQVTKAAKTLITGRPSLRRKNQSNLLTDIPPHKVTEQWVASHWLQLQYGWKPLVQDVFSAMGHLAYMQNRPQTLVYRASRNKKGAVKSGSPSYTLGGSSVQGKRIVAKLTNINEAALVGLTDPASLAWEKLPYSFVADWFVPIGDYLSARALSNALKGKFVISYKFHLRVTSAASRVDGLSFLGAEGFVHESITSGRSVTGTLPVPQPTVKGWAKIPTVQKAFTALALLSQAFSRK